MFRAGAFIQEFELDLKAAIDIRPGLHHEIVDVQVDTAEGIDDGEVRYRIVVRGEKGATHSFVSEQVLFHEEDSEQDAIERICDWLDSSGEEIRQRLRKAEVFDVD